MDYSDAESADLDPSMLAEAFPDLQRAATGVLDFLTPASLDPVGILNLARRLRDPKNTQSRRLSRFVANLKTESRFFGSSTFIDVDRISERLPSVPLDGSFDDGRKWQPAPVLLKANCAILAVDLLFQSNTPRHIIKELEARFPLPFMTGMVGDDKGPVVGKSSLERATFTLALDIRTQFLRMELEARRHEEHFDPEIILRSVFYDEHTTGELDGQGAMRGFRIAPFQDEYGHLPSHLPQHYRELVYDRVQDISMQLRNYDNDSLDGRSVNIQALRAAYHWQGFAFRAVRWIRERDDEIRTELRGHPRLDDVRDIVGRELNRRSRSAMSGEGNSASPPSLRQPEPMILAPRHAKRRRSKGPFLNAASVGRLSERLRTAGRPSYRNNDSVLQPASSNQHRQTLFPPTGEQPRRTREIPASPEADVSLQWQGTDEDAGPSGSDFQFTINDDVERSHTPSVFDGIGRRLRGQGTSPVAVGNTPTQPAQFNPEDMSIWNAISQAQNRPAESHETAAKEPSRRAFIDRQEDAHRISPISQPVDRAELQPRKRTLSESEHDTGGTSDDDDNAFSMDEHVTDAKGKAPQSSDEPHGKRQRPNGLNGNESDRQPPAARPGRDHETTREEPRRQENTATRRQVPWEQPRAPSPPVLPQTGWLSSASQGWHQKRWSEDETARLVLLVKRFGTEWAKIKRQDDLCPASEGGPKLSGRSQVQLKDRARTILTGYLRLVLLCVGRMFTYIHAGTENRFPKISRKSQ